MATTKRIQKPMPLKGRRTAWPADMIGQDFSPNAINVRFIFGEARSGPGRKLFDAAPVNELVHRFDDLSLSTDVVWALMLTTTHLYRRGVSTPGDFEQWSEILGTFTPTGTRRWAATSGEDKFFFSRGTDEIAYWDGVSIDQFDLVKNVVGFQGIGGTANCVAARYLDYFDDSLIAANVVENGTILANRIRYTESGDFRHWDETQALGAGFFDLNDDGAEAILNIRDLQGREVIYRKHSISDLTPTGTLAPRFVKNTRVSGIGIGAPFSLASTGEAHFFLGTDKNVWMWDGNRLTPIGTAIHEELRALVHNDVLDQYWGYCVPSRFEYWLLLSDPSRSSFDAFIYDYLRGFWTRDTFSNLYTVGETEIPLTSYIWLTIPGIWTDYMHTSWADLAAKRVTAMLGGRTDGATMQIDEQFAYDYFSEGSIIDRVLETEDMYLEGPWGLSHVVRLLLVYEAKTDMDPPFEIGISFDRGHTWHTQMLQPVQQGYTYVDFDMTGNVVRFRFRENDATGSFRWRSYSYDVFDAGEFIGTTTG